MLRDVIDVVSIHLTHVYELEQYESSPSLSDFTELLAEHIKGSVSRDKFGL
jgi:hypothetical protein